MTSARLSDTSRQPTLFVLPPGTRNVLFSPLSPGPAPTAGHFSFHGHRLYMEVPRSGGGVLPTDAHMSLLAALQHPGAPEIRGRTVLDLGCGSGAYSAAALRAGAERVTAWDADPACTRTTMDNTIRNGLPSERLETVTTDLASYRPERRFDLMLCGPAALGTVPGSTSAVTGPLIELAAGLLAPLSTVVVAQSSLVPGLRVGEVLSGLGRRRMLERCELDIPLPAHAGHRRRLLTDLERLRRRGVADFRGTRFAVETAVFSR